MPPISALASPWHERCKKNELTTGVPFQSKTVIAVGIGVRVRGEDVELGVLAAFALGGSIYDVRLNIGSLPSLGQRSTSLRGKRGGVDTDGRGSQTNLARILLEQPLRTWPNPPLTL